MKAEYESKCLSKSRCWTAPRFVPSSNVAHWYVHWAAVGNFGKTVASLSVRFCAPHWAPLTYTAFPFWAFQSAPRRNLSCPCHAHEEQECSHLIIPYNLSQEKHKGHEPRNSAWKISAVCERTFTVHSTTSIYYQYIWSNGVNLSDPPPKYPAV